MRLISRAVLREIWPPFLLGFAAYTFLLLIRTIFLMTDFFVRRSATFAEVCWLILLSVPWIVVLTLPMAFLLGVLIGVGRLASDSELVALRSCGVAPWALYRPALGAAAVLSLVVFLVYNLVLPRANDRLARTMSRLAATSIVNFVEPRTFREPRPGVILFFDRIGADHRSLEGVFLKLGPEAQGGDRLIVARRGSLTLEGDRLWLDLESSTVHEVDLADPSRYRVSWNRSQRILFAGDVFIGPNVKVTYEKGLRAQSLSELYQTAARARRQSPDRFRLAWVEIHKKLSIPFACFAFAFIGIPLAETSRRGGRGSSFALSLLILVAYYVLISSGETWAENGSLAPGLAMWLPNLLLLAAGAVAMRRFGRERARWGVPRWLTTGRVSRRGPAPESSRRAWFAGFLRFPAILDRYVLARFFSALLLVFASVLVLAVIVDYADQVDEILRNHPPSLAVMGYYRCFLLTIGVQVAPIVVLIATLVALGLLSKNNEDTAFKANGVSLHRLGAPILVVAVAGAGLSFWMGEAFLPSANQNQDRYRNIIHGRPVDYSLRTPEERNWRYGADGRIWHREESLPEKGILLSPSVFEFDSDFDLVRRVSARKAVWDGRAWLFRQGWSRTFAGARETSYRVFLEERLAGDPPRAFATERRTPDEMGLGELARYARQLRRTGYPTEGLETALQEKISRPMLIPLMALLALPFAFRLGRRGALAGVGAGLALGMSLFILSRLFSGLGDIGALPPLLAAWSPNILFGTATAYLLLRLRT